MRDFRSLHPLSHLIFLLSVLLPTMFLYDLPLLCLSLLGGIACLAALGGLRRGKALIFPFALAALSAVGNPLFSHRGVTELFFVNGNAYTLEALANGAVTGLSFAAAIVWCSVASILFTDDRILFLLGKKAPKTALVLSSALRMIPNLRRRYREIADTQRLLGRFDDTKFIPHCRSVTAVWSALASQAFDDARPQAILLSARGYDCGKVRTRYRLFGFSAAEILLTAASGLAATVMFVGTATGQFSVSFYPEISFTLTVPSYIFRIPAALLCFLPSAAILLGRLKWKFCKRKS